MLKLTELEQRILDVEPSDFESLALDIFRFQFENNTIYRDYVLALGMVGEEVQQFSQIPYLPISFFKTHEVLSVQEQIQKRFYSSGTTGMQRSQHIMTDVEAYLKNTRRGFEQLYGSLEGWNIYALLPSYTEQQGSSLIAMVDHWMEFASGKTAYLLEEEDLWTAVLQDAARDIRPTLVLGVTYALLDMAERCSVALPEHIVLMETGGMKGRRKEMVRQEVHQLLQSSFGPSPIHSEYGMTELTSQAYSKGFGRFFTTPTMQIGIRDINDPLSDAPFGKTGAINVVDLANVRTCSFIATEDLGRQYEDGTFEVLGRFDQSDARGCNLMIG